MAFAGLDDVVYREVGEACGGGEGFAVSGLADAGCACYDYIGLGAGGHFEVIRRSGVRVRFAVGNCESM